MTISVCHNKVRSVEKLKFWVLAFLNDKMLRCLNVDHSLLVGRRVTACAEIAIALIQMHVVVTVRETNI